MFQTDKEKRSWKMGMFMKVILSKEKKKEMENGFSKMVLFIRGPLKRTCSMERGHCRIRL
jgi:hypothetical protein